MTTSKSKTLRTIYKPSGRAMEYGGLAFNTYNGCTFGCEYCYVPQVMHKTKTAFHREAVPRLKKINDLARDCRILAENGEGVCRIFLCFTCDPYPAVEETALMTRRTIETIKRSGLNFNVLTKGSKLARRDFDLYNGHLDRFGVTLTTFSDRKRLWEPSSEPTETRIETLEIAHDRGIYTWVSLEPVIYANDTMDIILDTLDFVDEYRIGKLNHCHQPESIDWPVFLGTATALIKSHNKSYYIKEELHKYITANDQPRHTAT